jgi:hypothetical protein
MRRTDFPSVAYAPVEGSREADVGFILNERVAAIYQLLAAVIDNNNVMDPWSQSLNEAA